MTILRCDGCGGETFEPLGDPGYFRCHNCGAASTVRLASPSISTGGGAVWLAGPGPKKIMVIKVIRELTGWGLKEAKDLVDASEQAPQQVPLPAGSNPAKAIAELEGAGALLRR